VPPDCGDRVAGNQPHHGSNGLVACIVFAQARERTRLAAKDRAVHLRPAVDHERRRISLDVDDYDIDWTLPLLTRLEDLDPSYSYDVLVTVLEPAHAALTWDQIQRAGLELDELRRHLQHRRIAVVVPDSVRFGASRQIQAVTERLNITTYRPFVHFDDALAWLDEPRRPQIEPTR
tara:strand:+ start:2026 stop:2553 length:528 start_codon:yes stop_codon:yes gene_type:complete